MYKNYFNNTTKKFVQNIKKICTAKLTPKNATDTINIEENNKKK